MQNLFQNHPHAFSAPLFYSFGNFPLTFINLIISSPKESILHQSKHRFYRSSLSTLVCSFCQNSAFPESDCASSFVMSSVLLPHSHTRTRLRPNFLPSVRTPPKKKRVPVLRYLSLLSLSPIISFRPLSTTLREFCVFLE